MLRPARHFATSEDRTGCHARRTGRDDVLACCSGTVRDRVQVTARASSRSRWCLPRGRGGPGLPAEQDPQYPGVPLMMLRAVHPHVGKVCGGSRRKTSSMSRAARRRPSQRPPVMVKIPVTTALNPAHPRSPELRHRSWRTHPYGVVRRTRMVILLYYGPVCVPEAADLDAAACKHKSACIKHVPACSVHMSARCAAPAVIDSQGDHDRTWEGTGRRSPAGLLPECRAVAEHDHRPRTHSHALPPPDDLSLGGQALSAV